MADISLFHALARASRPAQVRKTLSPVSDRGWHTVFESHTGAWQQHVEVDSHESLLAFSAIYACVTLIASDIAKLRVKLTRKLQDHWADVTSFSPFAKPLLRPNHYQTWAQFIESWLVSKLLYGNAYVLKERDDARGLVTALYVLDPNRVRTLVAPDGSVYYGLSSDDLSRLHYDMPAAPASEVIHDRMAALHHPLVGTSPIYACGLSATQGRRIQTNSATFFGNASRPSGMLTAPAQITDDVAARLKATFEANFSGANLGRLFVAGDGLDYKALTIPAEDAQLIEQLRWTVEDVARAFRVPLHMLNAGDAPYPSGNPILS